MSPAATAPSSASVSACSNTSPSEWPARPASCGISTPPIFSGMPGRNSCESQPKPMRGVRCGLDKVFCRPYDAPAQAGLAAVLLRQKKFRQLQIGRRGDLHVARRTHHHMDRPSTALDQRGFIRAHEPVRSRFIERLLEQAKAKPLRRLRQHHALTRDRRNHDGAIGRPVYLLHGVDRGHAGNRSLILLHRLDYTQDRVLVNEGPHRIVHQNDVVVGRVDGRQRIGHGILPVLSALHHTNWFLQFLFFDLLLKARGFVLAQCHHDLADRRALRELAQRMEENWSSVQLKKLLTLALWTSGSAGHARTQSGCGNDDDDLHVGERSINAGPSQIQIGNRAVSYTHLRAHETDSYLVCRLLLEKKK